MSYKHILVAVDESPMSYAAVEQALELAKDLNSRVTLMSVIAVDPFVGVDFYKVAPAITDYFLHAEKVAQDRLAEGRRGMRQGPRVCFHPQTGDCCRGKRDRLPPLPRCLHRASGHQNSLEELRPPTPATPDLALPQLPQIGQSPRRGSRERCRR